jgi:hypothetical protein
VAPILRFLLVNCSDAAPPIPPRLQTSWLLCIRAAHAVAAAASTSMHIICAQVSRGAPTCAQPSDHFSGSDG